MKPLRFLAESTNGAMPFAPASVPNRRPSMKWSKLVVVMLAAVPAFATSSAYSVAASSQRTLAVTLRPVRGDSTEVRAVEVTWRLEGVLWKSKEPFSLRSPITYAGRTGIAERVDGLIMKDSVGIVSLTVENDSADPGGFPFYRHWRANRAVVPPIVVTYRMRSFSGVVTRGPQFDFYSHAGGISAGAAFVF